MIAGAGDGDSTMLTRAPTRADSGSTSPIGFRIQPVTQSAVNVLFIICYPTTPVFGARKELYVCGGS
jgi:hypothetical protein